jgi:hypothetical protein
VRVLLGKAAEPGRAARFLCRNLWKGKLRTH